MKVVYVVTYYKLWYDSIEEPIVTVFDNEAAARKMYNKLKGTVGIKVQIDMCPLYKDFKVWDK